ncbi:MAG: PKD domain-containing protein [Candidatus Bathyarchaeota archaeon]|nr:PKD domain-containing protein [Candidatus Bathyarchaeota archaeon]
MNRKFIACLLILSALSIFLAVNIEPVNAQNAPTLTFDPAEYTAEQLNEEFTVAIEISSVEHLWGWDANVTWDPECLSLVGIPQEGSFFSDQDITTIYGVLPAEDSVGYPPGKCTIADAVLGSLTTFASGSGTLATLTFKVIKPCSDSPLKLEGIRLIYERTANNEMEYITPSSTSFTAKISLEATAGPPIASAGDNKTVVQGTPVILNASRTVSVGNDTTYTWTFTDGTAQTLTGMIATYTFNNTGTYDILLTVQDSYGTDDASVTIKVKKDTTASPTPSDSSPSSTPVVIDITKNLPVTILGIIVAVTIIVVAGSVFWLRKAR